jgi:DNA modification methylase
MADLTAVFESVYNVTKDTGSLWVVVDTFKMNGEIKTLPFDLANQLKKIGWKLQDIIIWYKNKTLPWSSKGKLRNIFEYILFFSKTTQFKYYVDKIKLDPKDYKKWWKTYPERYNPNGKTPDRVWYIPIPTQGAWGNGWVRHFCPFPPELVERILLLTTKKGDIVLDPFAGSGSVLAQATVMGRKSIGLDMKEEYRDMYYDTVLPSIKKMWKTRKKELKMLEKERQNFKKTILKLRKLKYPKVLIKVLKKADNFSYILDDLNMIFVDGNSKDMETEITFIYDTKKEKEKIIRNLQETSQTEELKKFNLVPAFRVYSKRGFLISIGRRKKSLGNFYLYENGTTHFYSRKISSDKLKKVGNLSWQEKNFGIPLIVSPIRVPKKVINS